MNKIKLSEVKQLIREELVHQLNEFVSNEMGKGTSWKAGNKGWAAKNANGATNYFYGEDESSNKSKPDAFSKDSTHQSPEHK